MRYIAIAMVLLVAGCQEQTLRKAGNVHHPVWTAEHLRLFMAMGIDQQLKNHSYENIRDE